MVKSPIEGSTTVLLKMDQPISAFSDFIKPICLPSSEKFVISESTYCNTLSWARNRNNFLFYFSNFVEKN